MKVFSKKSFLKIKYLAIALLLILISILSVSFLKPNDPENPISDEQFYIVEKGKLQKIVETTGEIVPNIEVEIKCKASGEIIELPKDISDTVTKGEILLQLDPEDEETLVKQAEVSLAISEAKLQQSKLNLQLAEENFTIEEIRANAALSIAKAQRYEKKSHFQRLKSLKDKDVTSIKDFEKSHTSYVESVNAIKNAEADIKNLEAMKIDIKTKEHNIRIAEAQLESDKLSLSDANQRLRDITVTAPIDGVVSSQDVQVGQIIASGISNVDGGTTIMTIADLSHIYVLASVDESDIGNINNDQDVLITVDAYPELIFPGKVVRIATSGLNISSVVTFEVKIEIEGENRDLLKPGMTANVEILVLEKEDIIIIPITAVNRKLDEQYVNVLDENGNESERLIETGETDGENIEIKKGLEPGEKIIYRRDNSSKWRKSDTGTTNPLGGMGMKGMQK